MDVRATIIPEVKVVTPARFGDHRGFFCEVYNRRAFAEAGILADFVQDNQSFSAQAGTLRGLHFQRPPAAQNKLVRVLRGAVVDVAVDLRAGSPTFGRYAVVELSAALGNQMFCPAGFAHGFLTVLPDTEVAYKVDAYWAPGLEDGLRYDDPDLRIDWPLPASEIVIADKDRRWPAFRDLPPIFAYP